MFILSDQIIILFPADTFSKKQLIFRPHYKRNKYKLLEKKRSCVSPTMPNVGSKKKKKKKKKKKTAAFCLKKTTTTKKKSWGRIPGFHLSDKEKVYLWTLDYGGGRHSDFS